MRYNNTLALIQDTYGDERLVRLTSIGDGNSVEIVAEDGSYDTIDAAYASQIIIEIVKEGKG